MEEYNFYWYFYAEVFGVSETLAEKAIKLYKDPQYIYEAKDESYVINGLKPKEIDILNFCKNREKLLKNMDESRRLGIHMMHEGENIFPEFVGLSDPPKVLFYRGKRPLLSPDNISMVGARSCTEYGKNMAYNLALDFAIVGKTVISGLAVGIDGACHKGALDCDGQTYAVLGCGLDLCYPYSNKVLFERIIKSGSIISEYPVGVKALSWHFPKRNRIISALSDKLVVVEAKKKSGTYITVECALQRGNDIYALPGRATDPYSDGCNELIKQGAGLITDIGDVYGEELKIAAYMYRKTKNDSITLANENRLVYNNCDLLPTDIGTIIRNTRLPENRVLECLSRLEIEGFVEQPSKGYYCRKNV